MTDPLTYLDEIEAHVTSGIVSDADGAELAVSSIPALIAEVRRLRALSAHPAEETEYRVLDRGGDLWSLCTSLGEARHFLMRVPGGRIEERCVSPWSPVPADGEGR